MKVPPKRKGNLWNLDLPPPTSHPLNESPSEKEGKYWRFDSEESEMGTLNESPSEKEGKSKFRNGRQKN